MRSNRNRVPYLAIAAVLLWFPGAVSGDEIPAGDSDDSDKTVVERLLDIMLDAKVIDRGQYDGLLEQARREQAEAVAAVTRASEQAEAAAAVATAPPTPPVAAGPTDWNFKWSNGFKLDRNDGAFKLSFGGRIQTDAAFIWQSPGLDDSFDGEGSGTEFRRARLFFAGTVYDRLYFKAQYDFAQKDDDDNPDFDDVYVGLKDLGPVGSLQVGHYKEPVFLQEWTSSKYITFLERGLNSVFFPGRNMGVMAMNTALDDRLFWLVGGFRDTNDQGFAFDDWGNGDYDVAARLVGVPFYADDGERLLHLGASYLHRFRDSDGTTRYRQQPESHLAARYVDTMDFAADNVDIANLEASGVWGPLSVQGEFTGAWVDGVGAQPDVDLWGFYSFASYFLTGERRPYELGHGRYGRVKPKANFNPAAGGWGAWEVAARFSYLDLNDRNLRGGRLWDFTAGLNWYLYPNLRLQLNYIHSQLDDRDFAEGDPVVISNVDGHGDIFQMRLGFDF